MAGRRVDCRLHASYGLGGEFYRHQIERTRDRLAVLHRGRVPIGREVDFVILAGFQRIGGPIFREPKLQPGSALSECLDLDLRSGHRAPLPVASGKAAPGVELVDE